MTSRIPPWKEFELLITDIQRQLAPLAEVKHNHKIRGQSGRLRQLDVTATQKMGLVAVMIAFECKDWKRPVEIGHVEAFIQKLPDVGANGGVMISRNGFDDGARAVAKKSNVLLYSCRMAEEADWRVIVGADAWLTYVVRRHDYKKAGVHFRIDPAVSGELSLDSVIYKHAGGDDVPFEQFMTIHALLSEQIPQMIPTSVGSFEATVFADEPLYIRFGDDYREAVQFDATVTITATAYFLNLPIASGQVLVDVPAGEKQFVHAVSEGFDWQELIQTQRGKDLTQADYELMLAGPGRKLVVSDGNKLERYLRVVLTHANN